MSVDFGANILEFSRTAQFDDGGESGIPSIIFTHADEEKVLTPQTIQEALQFPSHEYYTNFTGDEDMTRFLTLIGYEGSLARLGRVKRPGLRKAWNFFFVCITRAFSNKCTILMLCQSCLNKLDIL